jgi:HD-GYP domain-containing protein (c-di-GMP phosphodiesterase class II)
MPLPYVQAGIRSGFSVPLKVGGAVLGVLNATSFQPRRHSREQMTVAEIIAGHAATALASARLYRAEHQARLKLEELMVALQQRETELVAAYQSTAASLVFLLEARDPYTRGHSDRVRHYCRQMARLLRLSVMETASLDQAAQLHDLGKIGIPDHILRKPAALSPAEWAEVRLHPEKTVKLLELLPFLKEALPIIRSHHERWDGRGYPDNRANEDIPLGAQLLAVADAYDALTTARPYRPALSHEQAIEELRMGRGKQWSPLAVDTLLRVLTESSHPDVSD